MFATIIRFTFFEVVFASHTAQSMKIITRLLSSYLVLPNKLSINNWCTNNKLIIRKVLWVRSVVFGLTVSGSITGPPLRPRV